MRTNVAHITKQGKPHRFLGFFERRLDVWLTSIRSSRWSRKIWWGRRNAKGQLFEEARLVPKCQRAEAIRLVLRALLPFVQVSDGCRVLRFREQEGIDRAWICKATGLSLWRVKRALADCTHAGLLGGYQPRAKRPDGEARGRPAIRWVNQKLLDFLGIWNELTEARRAAGKRQPVRRRPALPVRAGTSFEALALRWRV